jgi:hypothetical protein
MKPPAASNKKQRSSCNALSRQSYCRFQRSLQSEDKCSTASLSISDLRTVRTSQLAAASTAVTKS